MRWKTATSWVAFAAAQAVMTFSFDASADARVDEGPSAVSASAARRSAEAIACSSPKARAYLARTLRDVAERRWGLVSDDLETDTVDVVEDAVYEAASRGDAGGDALRRFLGQTERTCSPADLEHARRALAGADEPETKTAACERAGLARRRTDPACSVALAARAALEGEPDTTRARVADYIAAAAFDAIFDQKNLSEREKDVLFEATASALQEVVLAPEEADTIDKQVAHAFGGIDLEEVASVSCKKEGDLTRDLAEGATDAQDAFCSATRADLRPEKIEVTLSGPAGTEKTDLAALVHIASAATREHGADGAEQDHAKKDERIAEALLCELPIAPADRPMADCSTGTLRSTKAATFKLLIGGESWAISVAPGARGAAKVSVVSPERLGLAALVAGAIEATHTRYDIMALLEARFLGELPKPEALRGLALSALRVRRLAEALSDAKAEGGEHSYLLGLLDALPRLVPHHAASSPRCEATASAVDRVRCAVSGAARPLLAAAEDHHTRDLAVRVTTLLAPAGSESCALPASTRLLAAFAAYVPDADDARGESTHELAGHQLRAASADVSQCTEQRPGRGPVGFDITPSLALRASWNGGYLNDWGGDGFRVVPSLDVLATHVRITPASSRAVVGVRGSLVDLFAPFTELTMRRGDLDYDRQGSVWLDFVRPRVEVTVAVPQISQHLLLVAGVSLRMVAPFQGSVDPAAPKPSTSATYLTPFSSAPGRSEQFSRFFESSLGIKYVF